MLSSFNLLSKKIVAGRTTEQILEVEGTGGKEMVPLGNKI